MKHENKRETILKVALAVLTLSYISDGAIISCPGPLQNIAVYEGTLDTIINFPASEKGVKWSMIATTDEFTNAILVNYDDTVDPSLTTDYAFSSSGLTIKKATATADPDHQQSTAGLYFAECGGSRFGFKFLVVQSGPTCSCRKVSSSMVQLTCSSIYADIAFNPINAIFNLLVNGKRYESSDAPQRDRNDYGTYISTSKFTTDYSSSSSYQCVQTFDKPTDVQYPNIAMNAPQFSRTVSCSC